MTDLSDNYYRSLIQIRRPYFNQFELRDAVEYFRKEVERYGYLCHVDAAVEALPLLFPKVLRRRPRTCYQLTLDFANVHSDPSPSPRVGKSSSHYYGWQRLVDEEEHLFLEEEEDVIEESYDLDEAMDIFMDETFD